MRRSKRQEKLKPLPKDHPKYQDALDEADQLAELYEGAFTLALKRTDFLTMGRAMRMWKARALQAEEWLEKNRNQVVVREGPME